MACRYGRGGAMNLLANSGINILCKHKYTLSNALHVAVERGYYKIVS